MKLAPKNHGTIHRCVKVLKGSKKGEMNRKLFDIIFPSFTIQLKYICLSNIKPMGIDEYLRRNLYNKDELNEINTTR